MLLLHIFYCVGDKYPTAAGETAEEGDRGDEE
jgi:hypothetical protein